MSLSQTAGSMTHSRRVKVPKPQSLDAMTRSRSPTVATIGDRERVIASTDCGFGTFTRREWVIEPVVWLKLKAIRDGADIASARLWGRKVA